METAEMFGLVLFAGLIISSVILPPLIQIRQDITALFLKVYLPASAFFLKAYISISAFLTNFISNPIVQIVLITLMCELLIYLLWKGIYKLILIKRKMISRRKMRKDRIERLRNPDLKILGSEGLRNLSNRYKNLHTEFPQYKKEFNVILGRIKNRLVEEDNIQDLRHIEYQKREVEYQKRKAEEELERINHEIYVKDINEREKRERAIERLGIGDKEVFKASHLTPNEREIAKQEGYKAVNEYCVLENKIIPVLVKPPMNHSPTHAFLVWSVKKLLKKFPKIERIMEHETRDADLTFKIKTKSYAIEIEKGSLLRKKGQLKEKVEYLEDKYQDRWLILVSNKKLAKKYREFGKVATRKDLRNKIEKWVKNDKNR